MPAVWCCGRARDPWARGRRRGSKARRRTLGREEGVDPAQRRLRDRSAGRKPDQDGADGASSPLQPLERLGGPLAGAATAQGVARARVEDPDLLGPGEHVVVGRGRLAAAIGSGPSQSVVFAKSRQRRPPTRLMVTFFTAVLVGLWRGAGKDLLLWLAAAVTGSWLLPRSWHVLAGALAGGLVGALRRDR